MKNIQFKTNEHIWNSDRCVGGTLQLNSLDFQELKNKTNRLGTSDSTLNLHYLFLRGESGGASILQI